MASRRDQLNAYTLREATRAGVLVQSYPDSSEEGAPRPLRAVLPGTLVGVIIIA